MAHLTFLKPWRLSFNETFQILPLRPYMTDSIVIKLSTYAGRPLRIQANKFIESTQRQAIRTAPINHPLNPSLIPYCLLRVRGPRRAGASKVCSLPIINTSCAHVRRVACGTSSGYFSTSPASGNLPPSLGIHSSVSASHQFGSDNSHVSDRSIYPTQLTELRNNKCGPDLARMHLNSSVWIIVSAGVLGQGRCAGSCA